MNLVAPRLALMSLATAALVAAPLASCGGDEEGSSADTSAPAVETTSAPATTQPAAPPTTAVPEISRDARVAVARCLDEVPPAALFADAMRLEALDVIDSAQDTCSSYK